MVEAAMTFPLVLMFILLVIEFSLVMRDATALHGVGHAATRAASIAGNDLDADAHIISVINQASQPLPDGTLRRVVVYRASGPTDTVPSACKSGPQSNASHRCNHYLPSDLDRPVTDFGCQAGFDLDRFWCPTQRSVIANASSGGPPDFIGVYLEMDRPLLTGLFGTSLTVTSDDIIRIEPRDL